MVEILFVLFAACFIGCIIGFVTAAMCQASKCTGCNLEYRARIETLSENLAVKHETIT